MKKRILYDLRLLDRARVFRDREGTIRQDRFRVRQSDLSAEEAAGYTTRKWFQLERLRRVVTENERTAWVKFVNGEMPLKAIADCLGINRANVWRRLHRWLQGKRMDLIAQTVDDAISCSAGDCLINPRTGEEVPAGADGHWAVSECGSDICLSPRPDSQGFLRYIQKHRQALFETDDTYLRVERDPETRAWCLDIVHLLSPAAATARLRRAAEAADRAVARRDSCVIDPRMGTEVQAGTGHLWGVRHLGRERRFTRQPAYPQLLRYLYDHEDLFFGSAATYLWARYDPRARRWDLDVLSLLPLGVALEFAAAHGQEQVFHILTGETCAVGERPGA